MADERRAKRRFVARYWITTAVLLALVVGGCAFLVPALIRQAHAGRSITLLSAMLEGRAHVPLERYLEYWAGVWPRAVAGLVVVAVALFALLYFRAALVSSVREWFRRLPHTRPAHVVLLGVSIGLGLGFIEGVYKWSSQLFFPTANGFLSRHVLWMAPLTGAVAFGALGLLAWPAARQWPRQISFPVLLVPFGTLGIYSLVRTLSLGIDAWAALLFSLGAAIGLTRWTAAHPQAAVRGAIRLVGILAPATVLLAAALLVSNPVRFAGLRSRLPAPHGGPNILLIILDTVRARNLSLLGYERATTPNLERFGGEGVVFERAVATSSWTLPSHASMFTGRPNSELGTGWEVPLDRTHPTLAELLRDDGYETVAFVANLSYTTRESGLLRGFVRYEDRPMTAGTVVTHHWLARRVVGEVRKLMGNHRALMRVTAARIRGRMMQWLEARDRSRPFFAFINLFDAHEPYELPRGATSRFSSPGTRYWLSGEWRTYGPETLRELRDSYDDALAYLDTQLAELFEELDHRNLLDSTIVVVTSDHGEQFGERAPGLMVHGNSLYLSTIHVPLLIRYPPSVPAGVRVKDWVSLQDLPSTLLDLAGRAPELPGTSLVSSWSGGSPDALPFSELVPNESVKAGPVQSILEGPFHYLAFESGAEELYNVMSDPWEQQDLSTTPAAKPTLDQLRASFDQLLASTTSGGESRRAVLRHAGLITR